METILANSLAVLSVAYAITLVYVVLQKMTLRNYRFMQGIHADRIERLIAERDAVCISVQTVTAERDEATKQLVEMAAKHDALAAEHDREIGDLRREFDAVRANRDGLRVIEDKLQLKCNQLQARIAELERENADIERRCDVELARRSEAWKQRIAVLERENENLADIDKHYNAGWSDAAKQAGKMVAATLATFEHDALIFGNPPACCGVDTSEQEEAS